jgi:VanZ family protein
MAGRILSWTLLLLWLVVIFLWSRQPAMQSNQMSNEISADIATAVKLIAPQFNEDLISLNRTVRESAHVIAYFVHGLLMQPLWPEAERAGLRDSV